MALLVRLLAFGTGCMGYLGKSMVIGLAAVSLGVHQITDAMAGCTAHS